MTFIGFRSIEMGMSLLYSCKHTCFTRNVPVSPSLHNFSHISTLIHWYSARVQVAHIKFSTVVWFFKVSKRVKNSLGKNTFAQVTIISSLEFLENFFSTKWSNLLTIVKCEAWWWMRRKKIVEKDDVRCICVWVNKTIKVLKARRDLKDDHDDDGWIVCHTHESYEWVWWSEHG